MPLFFDFRLEEMSRVPVWVKFPNLPVTLWKEEFLSKICHQVGKLLMADLHTTRMEIWGFDRALVEIDLSKPLRKFIDLILSNGKVIKQQEEYEWLPLYCDECKQIGHSNLVRKDKDSDI